MSSVTSTLPLRVGAKTHPGKARDENQDRMSRFTTPLGEVFIVADGMGGHRGGAMAAMMTVEGFERHLQEAQAPDSAAFVLQDAARLTNAEIHRLAHSGDPSIAGMGSTLALALVSGRSLIIGHAGDSRAYLFRQGRLKRLTRDHSRVQKMIDHRILTEEEAREHPEANVINRAFGQKPEIELEISEPIELQPGDGALLCSDGLCGYVDDAAIEQAIRRHAEAQSVTDALIDLALKAGGEDNVTVQFLQFGERRREETETPEPADPPLEEERDNWWNHDQRGRRRSRLWPALFLLGAFLLGMLTMYALGRWRGWALPAPKTAPARLNQ